MSVRTAGSAAAVEAGRTITVGPELTTAVGKVAVVTQMATAIQTRGKMGPGAGAEGPHPIINLLRLEGPG
jgi:hypothetical protein